MAQKVQVLLVDDLDGGEAEETVSFGVDGSAYEIDLSASNASRLREALAPFVEAARKAPAKSSRGRRQQRNAPSRERSAEIRAWAKAAGKQVNERGRIPAAIVAEYEAAQR
ncbi:MAG: Lsr2 family protein [Nocardiopsaceae bacterium]|nr:Lsr2 family protein [Nocardiopsaceae bacterium]